jgi:hypothetical protein
LFEVSGALESHWGLEKLAQDLNAAGLISLSVGTSAPANTALAWLDVAGAGAQGSPGTLKFYDGAAWVTATASLLNRHLGGVRQTTGTTFPSDPIVGDEFYHSTDEILYKRVNDGGSEFWFDISSAGGGGSLTWGL